jgi:UDP-2,4-diacetamido-2,4,6-trideoxy-beta-L-altropyranose hydrolase
MHIAFRTDASLQIGTGHVMRCLTLADALRARGAQSTFFCRPHAGHLLDLIGQHGHAAIALTPADESFNVSVAPGYAPWLGTNWASDAYETCQALGDQMVDWLVVDHYALDRDWERALRPSTRRIMVIDDLADRPHDCDMLLDQTFGRETSDYMPWVSEGCRLHCGSQLALLRPEFAALRVYSLKRRAQPVLKKLLISMGGVDNDNHTGAVLSALQNCSLPKDCRLTVVMGQASPSLKDVQDLAYAMPWPTSVLINVANMAELMADSDLAIGAAGVTSWERCCLGLPSIILVLADNQLKIAKSLEQMGAAMLCVSGPGLPKQLESLLVTLQKDKKKVASMTDSAAKIVDGSGLDAVLKLMGV